MNQHALNPAALSEISHLFLSDVRDRQTGGAPRPVRLSPAMRQAGTAFEAVRVELPPEAPAVPAAAISRPRSSMTIDVSPAEFEGGDGPAEDDTDRAVSVVLCAHLGDGQQRHVPAYARHLAARHGRVGVIVVDGRELLLSCFEAHASGDAAPTPAVEALDERRMAEALEEMSFDVHRWLVVMPGPRGAEATDVLRAAPHWVLLSTADHDGVVASYRTLKSVGGLPRPALSLAVVGTGDDREAEAVYRKLSSVSRQFLDCPLDREPRVAPADGVAELRLLQCRQSLEQAAASDAPQWKVVVDLLAGSTAPSPTPPGRGRDESFESPASTADRAPSVPAFTSGPTSPAEFLNQSAALSSHVVDPTDIQEPSPMNTSPIREPAPSDPFAAAFAASDVPPVAAPSESAMPSMRLASVDDAEVIDLPAGGADAGVLPAVLRQDGDLVETPVKAPVCPEAVVCVGRDRRLTLVAMAGRGLGDLRRISMAYRWVQENRALIRMALPQFAVDAAALPALRLLVDHADLSADVLQPMFQSGAVIVRGYRKLRWGTRTGLLLEAA